MSAKPVNPNRDKKYVIPGKDKDNKDRNLMVTIDDSDLSKYVVDELDGSEKQNKIPTSAPADIHWFSCFRIKNKDNKNFSYSFTVNMTGIQKLYVAHSGTVHDVTNEMNTNQKVTLTDGDPPVGSWP